MITEAEVMRRSNILVAVGLATITEDGRYKLSKKGSTTAMFVLIDHYGKKKYPEITGKLPNVFFQDVLSDMIESGLISEVKKNGVDCCRITERGQIKAVAIMLGGA
jgi:hypothetical protein